MNRHRRRGHHHGTGINEVVHSLVGFDSTAIDRYDAEGDDPIPGEVETGRLEVEGGEGRVLPALPPFGRLRRSRNQATHWIRVSHRTLV